MYHLRRFPVTTQTLDHIEALSRTCTGVPESHARASERWLRHHLDQASKTTEQLTEVLWKKNWSVRAEVRRPTLTPTLRRPISSDHPHWHPCTPASPFPSPSLRRLFQGASPPILRLKVIATAPATSAAVTTAITVAVHNCSALTQDHTASEMVRDHWWFGVDRVQRKTRM